MTELALHAAPDAPVGSRVRRAAVSVLFWSFAVAAGVLLWPSSLGGCTTMIVVTGHSMDPTYATGDLVVARCGRPQVGDVVVYQPDGVRGHIIHRLVGGNGVDGWQVKGDNNSWQDPFSPADADVVGVAKFHLPRIGLATTALAAPIVWAPLLVIAIAIFIWPRDDDEDAEPDDRAAAEPGDEDADADADPHAIATSRDGQDVLL